MCEALWDQLDIVSKKLGRTQVMRKITSSQLLQDETVTPFFTTLLAFWQKLIGRTENSTDDTMKTHIFTTLSNLYETTTQILQQ
jgi:hypothetical protein